MIKYLIAEKISPHRSIDSSGNLICTDAICSRTGEQIYAKNEIYENYDKPDANDEVSVFRPKEEVFDERAMASFENVPVVIDHPDEDVNTENRNNYQVGYMRDVHQGKDGDEDVMLATLVITDQDTIDKVQDGTYKYLSCGYDCIFCEEDGKIVQRKLRGNHIAICGKPRAGITRIQDSIKPKMKSYALDFEDAQTAKKAKDYLDKFKVQSIINDNVVNVFAENDDMLKKIINLVKQKYDCKEHKALANDSAYGQPIERNTVTIRRGYHNLSPAADKFKDVYVIAMKESSMINIKMLINCLEAMYIDAYNDSKEAYQKDIAAIAVEKYSKALQLATDFKIKRKSQLNDEQYKQIEKYISDIESLCEEINGNAIPSTFKQDLLAMIDKYGDSSAQEGESSLSFNKEDKPTETEEDVDGEDEDAKAPSDKEQEDDEQDKQEQEETTDSCEDSADKYTVIADSPEEAARLVKIARRYVKNK